MTLFYLIVAVAGLPVVLYGQRSDRLGRSSTTTGMIAIRAAGAATLFGGLTGFALSLLSVHPVFTAVAAVAAGASAAVLRVTILRLTDPPGAGEG